MPEAGIDGYLGYLTFRIKRRAGEMALMLKAHTALVEVPSSVVSTHVG